MRNYPNAAGASFKQKGLLIESPRLWKSWIDCRFLRWFFNFLDSLKSNALLYSMLLPQWRMFYSIQFQILRGFRACQDSKVFFSLENVVLRLRATIKIHYNFPILLEISLCSLHWQNTGLSFGWIWLGEISLEQDHELEEWCPPSSCSGHLELIHGKRNRN